MSLITGTMPDFTKAVFSIWFRVPAASIQKASAAYQAWVDSDNPVEPPFAGIVPVFSFGPRTTALGTDLETRTGGSFTVTSFLWSCTLGWVQQGVNTLTNSFLETAFDSTKNRVQEPSFIGVDCSDPTGARLCVSFVTNSLPTVAVSEITGADNPSSNEWLCGLCPCLDAPCPGFFTLDSRTFCDPIETVVSPIITRDTSQFYNSFPQVFRNTVQKSGDSGFSKVATVKPDVWHHALVSIDFSTGLTVLGGDVGSEAQPEIISAPQLYVALDDVDISGDQLSDNNVFFNTPMGGPHDLMTITSQAVAEQSSNNVNIPFVTGGGTTSSSPVTPEMPRPTYSLGVSTIPGNPTGVPSLSAYVDNNLAMNLGPVQVFTGRTVDTGSLSVRRLFVDDKGKPASSSLAKDYFGGKPDIDFSSVRDWQKGHNHGTSGDFAPTGEIDGFKPKPSLFGAQQPEELTPPK